ncbi:MAG: S41 family peptidase [Candidatus Magasanikbacteria bacterium]|jgi:carboxyl-terminal processing protease|nr:S41 family peptidase [Candidatus Magasanikbacteria bacterium]
MTRTKKIILGGSIGVFLFGVGFFTGSRVQTYTQVTNTSGKVEINKIIDLYQRTRSEEVSFDQFWKVWDMVQKGYVEQPVRDEDLFYSAIQGLVQGLGDPYSVYFPPQEAEEFAKDLSGEFEGIGAEIGIRDEQLTVIAPLPSSPADKAGLTKGDTIFAIDTVDTTGITVEQAIAKIRGKRGTPVVLTVMKKNASTLTDISIIREKINIPTVTWEKKSHDIIYLRVSYFNEDTQAQFDAAMKDIVLAAPKGIILDLRSNPGGFLDTSVRVASEWIPSGSIVKEQFQDGSMSEYPSAGTGRFASIPTVVLIDEGTASGSEIVAGALQDYNKATLLGTQTFGKGSVQTFEVLPDGSALKLTIAKWLTPKGREINGVGVAPDEVLEEMFKEDATQPNGVRDLGVERAIELLN